MKDLNKRQLETWRRLQAPPEAYKTIHGNADLAAAMKYSTEVGYVITPLANYFVKIAGRYTNQKTYKYLTYRRDLEQEIVLNLLKYWTKFDHSKSSAPLSYLVRICESTCIRFTNTQLKHQYLKEKLINEQRSKKNFYEAEDECVSQDKK